MAPDEEDSMDADLPKCDHAHHTHGNARSAITICHCCRDFLCSICGNTIDWYAGLHVALPGVQWRYCAKYTCIEAESAYHALPFEEMIQRRIALRNKRVLAHLQDRGIQPQASTSDTIMPRTSDMTMPMPRTTMGRAERIFIPPHARVLAPGEACWCNLGKDCTGYHEVYIAAPVNHCGFCGQEFRAEADDPHFLTGKGPRCPTRLEKPNRPMSANS